MFYLVRNKDRQNVPLTSVSYFLMINQKFQLLVILKTLVINDSCSVPIGIQDKLGPIAETNVEICQNVCIDILDKYASEKQKYVIKSCNYVCSL